MVVFFEGQSRTSSPLSSGFRNLYKISPESIERHAGHPENVDLRHFPCYRWEGNFSPLGGDEKLRSTAASKVRGRVVVVPTWVGEFSPRSQDSLFLKSG